MQTTIVTGVTGPVSTDDDVNKTVNTNEDTNIQNTQPIQDTPSVDEAKEVLENVGLNFDGYFTEFAEKGALSEESYIALEKAGISHEMVDAYIKGQEAINKQQQSYADETVKELMSIAGGQEDYQKVIAWASENLSTEAVDAFNQAIESGNAALASIAIKGLVSQYTEEFGSDPTLVGGGTLASNVEKFNSIDEMVRAMSDPRYKTDDYYRKQVESKIVRSHLMRRA